MADSPGLKLLARRDDGAYLIEVTGSPCALLVAADEEEGGPWASPLDVFTARGNWTADSAALPEHVVQAARAHIAKPGWCDAD